MQDRTGHEAWGPVSHTAQAHTGWTHLGPVQGRAREYRDINQSRKLAGFQPLFPLPFSFSLLTMHPPFRDAWLLWSLLEGDIVLQTPATVGPACQLHLSSQGEQVALWFIHFSSGPQ